MSIKMIIGADLVPTKSNFDMFSTGNDEELFGRDLIVKLRSMDFTVFNLEVPLANHENPIKKCGPNLIAPTSTIKGLHAVNPHFFTLANNHILDQGEKGLYSTMQTLDEYGIAYAGAGKNLAEATKPYIYKKNGLKVGIYCCAEHEFSIAGEKTVGVNPFDPLESLEHITELKKCCDYVVVLYHGGKEHYRYPAPYLQKVCRKIVDNGADLVICQHSHCIGCEEKWNNSTIIYGQGNFLFDDCDEECWQTSLLLELEFLDDKKGICINYLPLKKQGNKVRIATSSYGKKILEDFRKRSDDILIKGFVSEQYDILANEMKWQYLGVCSGKIKKNILYRILNKLTINAFSKKFLSHIYGTNEKLNIQNYVECEAHRNLMIQAIKVDMQQER